MQLEQFIEMLKKAGADYVITEGTKVTVGRCEFVFHVNGDIAEIYEYNYEGC